MEGLENLFGGDNALLISAIIGVVLMVFGNKMGPVLKAILKGIQDALKTEKQKKVDSTVDGQLGEEAQEELEYVRGILGLRERVKRRRLLDPERRGRILALLGQLAQLGITIAPLFLDDGQSQGKESKQTQESEATK